MRLPVFCPNCKSIFPSRGYSLSGRNISLWGNKETCPVCGFDGARLSEGVFNITNETIEVISAPDLTVEMLAAFAEIARRAADDEISEQQAVEQANSISPKLGKLLGASYANGIATLGLLGSLVGLYLTYSNNKSSEVANETLLNAITEQTFVLKQIKESLSVPQKSGAKPTEGKPEKKFSAKKLGPEGTPKSSRRAQVNHARREALRIRREQFGGARHH